MLSLEVHRELVALIGAVNRLIAAATQRAPIEEIELRVAIARLSMDKLELMTGSTFGNMGRHLYWLERNHRGRSPASSDGDITDLRDHDLPAAVAAVTAWTSRLLDTGLVAAITRSWEAQDYDGAIRDAFIELEARMKALASAGPDEALFGRRLVKRLFDPAQLPASALGAHGFMGELTKNEVEAARDLVGGGVGLFRNATAHRVVPYTRDEASDIVHLVNVCLRIIDKMRTA
jgi:hypothetical protein